MITQEVQKTWTTARMEATAEFVEETFIDVFHLCDTSKVAVKTPMLHPSVQALVDLIQKEKIGISTCQE